MRLKNTTTDSKIEICQHVQLLGHSQYGVTELRTFEPRPMVAYADNEDDIVRLTTELDREVPGIYIGVQPRLMDLFDKAPNCWKPAVSNPQTNCGCDRDIEFITACFFDIDVVSTERMKGCPATEEELQQSLQAAILLSRENGLALSSTICCSGNGHYVLAPIVPIPVDGDEVAEKFRQFCHQIAEKIARQVSGIKIDPVYNLSRVMRLMGTVNGKGQPSKDRPHRRAHFITEPISARSMALHHMILNTEIAVPNRGITPQPDKNRCDLTKIESCEFIKWCRKKPIDVSEPQWFAMITNLANLEGGPKLIHEISRLDMFRYDYQQTQRLIERVQCRGYSPANCKTIRNNGFYCAKLGQCQVKASMYLTRFPTMWNE
ncbi:MAG: hypothetical protein JXB29_06690 [Sedimentisphaerales bacterium]|nr:hypothetical protein [Sedimentisphaerales bacterium]